MEELILWELCKRFKLDYTNKCYMHNQESVQENEKHILRNFDIHTDHLISDRRPDLIIIIKKENLRNSGQVMVKLKESEKRDKHEDLPRELQKLWNMKVTVISILIGALGTVTKGIVQGLDVFEIIEREETLQNISLFWSGKILRRILETWGDLLSFRRQ